MATELQQMIEVVAKDKGIDPVIVITAIEDAYVAASRKVFKGEEDLRARFNPETGLVELYAVRAIVADVEDPLKQISLAEAQDLYGEEAEVGMEIEFPKETERLGRIAAQTAKQVIAQRVREAEREKIHAEFSERVGEVVNATVKRFESGDIIAEIGRVEAQVPRREQSRAENYAIGDRVRCVIKAVSKNAKGPQVILSRTDPALLVKLFEQEVPEIYDGTVMIRGAVREAGDRAKVAVYSRERDVDPVGACVGMRGTRVQAIIRELRGEKIDIVEWSEDAVTFVTKALSPARVQRVSIVDDEQRVMEVVVEDRQLSLAIGKKGQNVRLAAKLTGWKIDIKSEEDKRKEVEAQLEGLDFSTATEVERVLELPEIHVEVVAALKAAGYDTVEKVLEAGPETLATLPDFDAETVEAVLAAAQVQKDAIDRELAERAEAEAAAKAEAEAVADAEAASGAEEPAEADAGTADELGIETAEGPDAAAGTTDGDGAETAAVGGDGTDETKQN